LTVGKGHFSERVINLCTLCHNNLLWRIFSLCTGVMYGCSYLFIESGTIYKI